LARLLLARISSAASTDPTICATIGVFAPRVRAIAAGKSPRSAIE